MNELMRVLQEFLKDPDTRDDHQWRRTAREIIHAMAKEGCKYGQAYVVFDNLERFSDQLKWELAHTAGHQAQKSDTAIDPSAVPLHENY